MEELTILGVILEGRPASPFSPEDNATMDGLNCARNTRRARLF